MIVRNIIRKGATAMQIWWLKKRLPKLMAKANRAVVKEEQAERKLAKLYTDMARAQRQNGFMS